MGDNEINLRHRVMVIGETGVGKSSLINHLIGKEVARVGAAGSVTRKASLFLLNESLELVDTRGTEEANAGDDPWNQLEADLLEYRPSMVAWVLSGHSRDRLDDAFKKVESLLHMVFRQIRLDPLLIIIANKMDMLEPAGDLPNSWPDYRSDKGKNIQARLKQLNNLHRDFISAELCCLEPTFLDWYKGAKPWNIDGIRDELARLSRVPRGNILRKMSIPQKEFANLLALQQRALELDIQQTTDTKEKAKKLLWAQEFFKNISHKPSSYNSFSDIPTDPVTRNAYISQILLFTPYMVPFGACEEKIKFDSKQLNSILRQVLLEKGSTEAELDGFLQSFSKVGKELDPGFFTLQNFVLILAAILFGGILLWWMAPVIGGWLGAWLFGLHGAAAVSAGLAWLGLGSLAAGGFGMFGGTVVIVGAGSILAGSTSAVALQMLSNNLGRTSALLDCSRVIQSFDVILAEINEKALEEQAALDFIQDFAVTRFKLRDKLPIKEEEFRQDEKFGNKRLEDYKAGLEVYDRAFDILEKRREKTQIRFYREQ